MDVHAVRQAVAQGRAVKHPGYHASKRGIAFSALLTALERCYHVGRDDRLGPDGQTLHPRGWYALATLPHRRRLRIEFDALRDRQGDLLLIVTAYYT